MKKLLLLLFASIVIGANAQEVTLRYENAKLNSVLESIEKQTDKTVAYSPADIDTDRVVSIRMRNEEVGMALGQLFKGTDIEIEITENKIYLIKKAVKDEPKPKKISVSGVVVNDKNQPVIGATVVIKGTRTGVSTNTEGMFSLKAYPNQMIMVSYVGSENFTILASDKNIKRITLEESSLKVDEVVVVGYRQSLSKAIDIKQQNINATDAIVADDIAKFPQSNMAEALQRVSGVQITRDGAGGVGNQVSIRGMGAEYTKVTIDGNSTANADASESFNFNTMPAEIFSRLEVTKSPTAKIEEGGVGGTVNLVMRKPFELDERVLIVSVEGQSNTQNQEGTHITPKATITYGENWNNKFGIIAAVSYSDFANASEAYDVVRYNQKSFDLDGDGVFEHKDVRIPFPRLVSQGQEVERISGNLSAQYRINQNMNLVWTGMVIQNENVGTRYSPIWFTDDANPTEIVADGPFVESITFDNVNVKLENQLHTTIGRNYQTGLTYKWKLPRGWGFGAKGVYSLNTSDQERYRYYATNTNSVTYTLQGNLKFFDIDTPTNFSDANQFLMEEARKYVWEDKDEIITGKYDFVKRFDDQFVLEFGGSVQSRTKSREYWYKKHENINEPFMPVAALLTGFMDNVDEATFINEFLIHDWDKSYDMYGSKIDLSDSYVTEAYYDINQFVNTGYVMSEYKGDKLKGNVGVRYAHTKITSDGYDVDDANSDEYKEISKTNSYGDFLPSVHISYEPWRKFYIKGSYAKVLTRPRIQDLSSYQRVNDINMTISAKNPDLQPYRAHQYDASVEWYPTKGVLLSASYFRKDIDSFITTQSRFVDLDGEKYELRQPVNGDDAMIQGVEVNYQQPFTFLPSPFDGFGIVANYTLSLSEYNEEIDGVNESFEMPNNSKHSYNIIGYYEKYGVGVRIAYNFRDGYLREKPNPQDGLKYRDSFGQTDISASYEFGQFMITANVLNAFNAQSYEYIWEEDYMDNVSISGIAFQLGLRVTIF